MSIKPRHGITFRFPLYTLLVWLGCSGLPLHAQRVYTSTKGETSIYSNYDPTAPAPKAPVTSTTAAPSSMPFLPAIPMEQYLAQKADISRYSQSNFPVPSPGEVSPTGPRAPTTLGPIVPAPTFTWDALPDSNYETPNPDLAVGPNDVVMVINETIAQFNKAGTLQRTVPFATWFGDVLSGLCSTNCLLFDPWVAYDQMHGHFLLLVGVTPSDPALRTYSYLLLSASNGPNFNGGWKNWAMRASFDGSIPTQNWGDSWRLGVDNQAIYLSGNMFNTAGAFQYAKIRVLKKTDVYTTNPSATTLPYQELGSATVPLLNQDGTLADSLVPIHQRGIPGAGGVGLFVSATNFNLPANFLTVWKIANPLAASLTMTQFNVSGLMSYKIPAPAPQAGGPTLDSGDARMLKVIYRNGFLYTARNSGYPDQATTVTYDVIDTAFMSLSSQARLLNSNSFYPAFDVPATVPLGAQFTTANQIAGTTTSDGKLTFPGISSLKAGEWPYLSVVNPCGANCRWGDYFGASVDPVSGGLWVSGEYSKVGHWGTWAGYFPWLTSPTFNDVPSTSAFFDFINVFSSWQITTGCGANPPMFCPTDLVTRDQFATFLIRSMTGNNFTYSPTPHFTDVPASSPFFPYIQKLADLGLTHGCTPTTYCPSGLVSRQDAAVLIVRGKFEALFGDNFTYPAAPYFTDVPKALVQFPYVQKMFELGLTSGCSATTFCPNSNLTRQEIAVFLERAFLN